MVNLLFVIGQTASGKNSLSHLCARKHNCRIISVDSMKVYRGMDIGTAKPSPALQSEVSYEMINVLNPDEILDVKWYVDSVDAIIAANPEAGFILSGGSALYIKSILCGVFDGPPRDDTVREELEAAAETKGAAALHQELAAVDPEAAAAISNMNAKRIIRALEVYRLTGKPISESQVQFDTYRSCYNPVIVGLRHERTRLYARINQRVDRMWEQGLPDEVIQLHAAGTFGQTARHAIGYREIIDAIEAGEDPRSHEIRDKIKRNTRVFSRKQMTWYRKFENVNWIDVEAEENAEDVYQRIIPYLKQAEYC